MAGAEQVVLGSTPAISVHPPPIPPITFSHQHI